jgi:hypothetical protein
LPQPVQISGAFLCVKSDTMANVISPTLASIDPTEPAQQEEEETAWRPPSDSDCKDASCLWAEYYGPLPPSDRIGGPTSPLAGHAYGYDAAILHIPEWFELEPDHFQWSEAEYDQLWIDSSGVCHV